MTSLLLGSLGVAGIAILFAIAYRRDAMKWRAKVGDLATDLLEAQQLAKELDHEGAYWRELAAWLDDHRDRSPTTEECDQMWERVIARRRFQPYAYSLANPLFTQDGVATWVDDAESLTKGKP